MTPEKKTSTTALMLDVETLALTPDAHVVQVGFCVGDWKTKEVLVSRQTRWMEDEPRGRFDPDTARWWLTQDLAVIKRVFVSQPDDRVSAEDLHRELAAVAGRFNCDVWASPAMFDLPILTSMFQRAGLGKPWKYSSERDMMTLYKLIDPQGGLQPPANEMEHDAGCDAEWQLRYLFRLMDRLHGVAS